MIKLSSKVDTGLDPPLNYVAFFVVFVILSYIPTMVINAIVSSIFGSKKTLFTGSEQFEHFAFN